MKSNGSEMADQLERLASLHASGALSDPEFDAAKARVLGSAPLGATHGQGSSFGPSPPMWPQQPPSVWPQQPQQIPAPPSATPSPPRRRRHLTWTPNKTKVLTALVVAELVALGAGGYQSLSASANSSGAPNGAAIVALAVGAVLALWVLLFVATVPVRVACMRGVGEGAVAALQLAIFLGIWFGGIGWVVAVGIALFAPPGQFDWYATTRKPLLL